MEESTRILKRPVNRRSLLKGGLLAGGAATLGAGLLGKGAVRVRLTTDSAALNKGDIAILQFLAAAELIESDLWIQYAELGGIGTNFPIEVDPNPNLESLSGCSFESRRRRPAIHIQQHPR